jgi:diguanylate cyclase (GGDEF)-like protein
VVSALLTTKSFASAFSQEQLMRALEEEKERVEAANLLLLAERQLARATLDALLQHVCVIDETGTILATNRRWLQFGEANGGFPGEGSVGADYLAICDKAEEPDREEAASAAAGIRSVLAGEADRFVMEYACDSPTGKRWFVMNALRAEAPFGARVVIAHQDISEQKRAEEQLRQQALIDGLTGIANRRAFDDALGREWRRACRSGTPLALLMIDVDHFKRYNDHYGHQAGDQCLRAVAGALAGAARRPADLVARYGGEEFAVILPGCSITDAQMVGEKMRRAVADLHLRHEASDTASEVTVSIGVSCLNTEARPCASDGDGVVAGTLIADADTALYRAKTDGRNRVFAQAS